MIDLIYLIIIIKTCSRDLGHDFVKLLNTLMLSAKKSQYRRMEKISLATANREVRYVVTMKHIKRRYGYIGVSYGVNVSGCASDGSLWCRSVARFWNGKCRDDGEQPRGEQER